MDSPILPKPEQDSADMLATNTLADVSLREQDQTCKSDSRKDMEISMEEDLKSPMIDRDLSATEGQPHCCGMYVFEPRSDLEKIDLRSSPTYHGDSLETQIDFKCFLPVIEEKDGWIKVVVHKKVGWVSLLSSKHLSKVAAQKYIKYQSWPGKQVFLFRGRLAFGPHWFMLIFVTTGLVGEGLLLSFGVFEGIPAASTRWALQGVLVAVVLLDLFFLWKCATRDPGILPRRHAFAPLETVEEALERVRETESERGRRKREKKEAKRAKKEQRRQRRNQRQKRRRNSSQLLEDEAGEQGGWLCPFRLPLWHKQERHATEEEPFVSPSTLERGEHSIGEHRELELSPSHADHEARTAQDQSAGSYEEILSKCEEQEVIPVRSNVEVMLGTSTSSDSKSFISETGRAGQQEGQKRNEVEEEEEKEGQEQQQNQEGEEEGAMALAFDDGAQQYAPEKQKFMDNDSTSSKNSSITNRTDTTDIETPATTPELDKKRLHKDRLRELPEPGGDEDTFTAEPSSVSPSDNFAPPSETFASPPRLPEGWRYCHTCNLCRPRRAKHCRFCNCCIDRFDHHCGFIGTCVGQKNRSHFMAFLSLTAFYCIFGLVCAGLFIFTDVWDQDEAAAGKGNNTESEQTAAHVYISFVVAVFFSLSVPCLCGYHVWLLSLNLTTNEHVTRKAEKHKIRWRKIVRNWKESFFGTDDVLDNDRRQNLLAKMFEEVTAQDLMEREAKGVLQWE